MKNILAMLAVLLVAGMASGQTTAIGKFSPKTGGAEIHAYLDSSDVAGTYLFGQEALRSSTLNFERGSAFVGTLYACDTMEYAAATCDTVSVLSADVSNLEYTTGRRYFLLTITNPETGSNISTLSVRGTLVAKSSGSGSGSSSTVTQPSPTSGSADNLVIANITDPATTELGYGYVFGDNDGSPSFLADTYPGSGVSGNEADNGMGNVYNQNGCGGTMINPFEHSFDDCWETSFRGTTETGDETWVERNWDMRPPNFTAVITGISGTFTPGEYLTFSPGGGTGEVLTWSTPNLKFVQNYGITADSETVTGVTSGATGTLTTLVSTGPSDVHRPLFFKWNTVEEFADWSFFSVSTPGIQPAIKIQTNDGITNKVGINASGGGNPEGLKVGTGGLNLDTGQLRLDGGTGTNLSGLWFMGASWDESHIGWSVGATDDNRFVESGNFRNASAGRKYVHEFWDETNMCKRFYVDDGDLGDGRPTAETDGDCVITENSDLDFLTTGTIKGGVDIVATTTTTDSPSADEMRGSFHTSNNASGTDYTLPTAAAGLNACFYDLNGGGVITLDAAAGDEILLNGSGVGVADAIDSPGAIGDFICLVALDATNWLTVGRSGTWIDGGVD